MPKPLPIRVDAPCEERWVDMRIAGEGRHCDRCVKTVVDLSRMTRPQAESVVRAHGGSLCARLATDERGETVFRAEPRRLPVLGPALAGMLAACAPQVREAPVDAREATVEPEAGAWLDASRGGFGGSLATGVMMPMAPEPEPTVAVVEVAEVAREVRPTNAQIALTERKQQRRDVVVVHRTMGVVRCPIGP